MTSATRERVLNIATRFQAARIVQLAEISGLIDLIDALPSSDVSVAQQLGWQPNRVRHLLDALVSIGLLHHSPSSLYSVTSLGKALVHDARGTAAPMVRHEHLQQDLWADLSGVFASESPVDGQQDRTMVEDPERLAVLLSAMLAVDSDLPARIGCRHGWERVRRIADIAGGHGAVLAHIAQSNQHVTGTVFDQPPARNVALSTFDSFGVSSRCQFGAIDLRSSEPLSHCDAQGFDCILAVRCLHNFDSSTIRRILEGARSLLSSGGLLIVVDVRLEWSDGFAVPEDAATFGAYLAVNCAGGWLPTVDWWESELSSMGGQYLQESLGPYDLHEVAW